MIQVSINIFQQILNVLLENIPAYYALNYAGTFDRGLVWSIQNQSTVSYECFLFCRRSLLSIWYHCIHSKDCSLLILRNIIQCIFFL